MNVYLKKDSERKLISLIITSKVIDSASIIFYDLNLDTALNRSRAYRDTLYELDSYKNKTIEIIIR